MKYAADTSVSVEQSRMEIERTVRRYGADQFMSGWRGSEAMIGFVMHDRQIKFVLPLPDRHSEEFTHYRHNSGKLVARSPKVAESAWEQACRQRWRALNLVIKAKLEAVECGISEFEAEFLANIVLPNGTTYGEFAIPQIAIAYETKKMPPILPLLEDKC